MATEADRHLRSLTDANLSQGIEVEDVSDDGEPGTSASGSASAASASTFSEDCAKASPAANATIVVKNEPGSASTRNGYETADDEQKASFLLAVAASADVFKNAHASAPEMNVPSHAPVSPSAANASCKLWAINSGRLPSLVWIFL